MKKIFYTFGILFIAYGFTACSGSADEAEDTDAIEEEAEVTAEEDYDDDSEVSEDTQKDLEEAWDLEADAEQLGAEMDALLDSLENE